MPKPKLPAAQQSPARRQRLTELLRLERGLTVPSLSEAIRLLESEKFHRLTSAQIRAIAQYQSIEIAGERFFDKAFSTGKEAAGSLGYAQQLGREAVLEDLRRLRATAVGPSPPPDRAPDGAN
jgi:hypothetical protein